jgi:hypothetical protein
MTVDEAAGCATEVEFDPGLDDETYFADVMEVSAGLEVRPEHWLTYSPNRTVSQKI